MVGANGTGKTTLLVCMERICNPFAFARGFANAKNISGIDNYSNASIRYDTDTVSLNFRKKKSKWACTPRKDSKALLANFGFFNTVFVKADSKRIDANSEEIRNGTYIDCDNRIITAMNDIFETEKYTKLQQLKIGNGRGKSATYIYVLKLNMKYYYSEKRFSSGELAVLRLVEKINSSEAKILFLLDEAEMALHPRIQKNLYNYLKEKSKELDLMVIVSTHSSTLIKSVPKENIILLSPKEDNTVEVVFSCYPARAIGCIDFEVNNIFDFIFFVEDDMARNLLKKQVEKYINLEPDHKTLKYTIIPVGGYQETAKLAIRTDNQLFQNSKVFAVLDKDAFVEGFKNPQFYSIYTANKHLIKSLGCTPEQWIVEHLENGTGEMLNKLKRIFHCELHTIKNNPEYKKVKGQNIRKIAKVKLDIIISIVKSYSGDNEDIIIDKLIELIIKDMTDGEIKEIIAPMIKTGY